MRKLAHMCWPAFLHTHMHMRAHDLMRSSMRLSVARKCHVLSSGEKSRAHQQSHGWG